MKLPKIILVLLCVLSSQQAFATTPSNSDNEKLLYRLNSSVESWRGHLLADGVALGAVGIVGLYFGVYGLTRSTAFGTVAGAFFLADGLLMSGASYTLFRRRIEYNRRREGALQQAKLGNMTDAENLLGDLSSEAKVFRYCEGAFFTLGGLIDYFTPPNKKSLARTIIPAAISTYGVYLFLSKYEPELIFEEHQKENNQAQILLVPYFDGRYGVALQRSF